MSTLGRELVQFVKANGIPEPWQGLGMLFSADGALGTQIQQCVLSQRSGPSDDISVFDLFRKKSRNLQEAREIIHHILDEFDSCQMWKELDTGFQPVVVNDLVEALASDLSHHPFPLILTSLEFNWNFIKKHGTRAFYVMTDKYLATVEEATQEAERACRREWQSGFSDPYWLLRFGLVSIETPGHCSTCRMTIAVILAARDAINTTRLVAAQEAR